MSTIVWISRDEIQNRVKDYYLASWIEDELVLQPYCHCGQDVGEDYFCPRCGRTCTISCFVCVDQQALAVVEKFVFGHPQFRHYEAFLLRDDNR